MTKTISSRNNLKNLYQKIKIAYYSRIKNFSDQPFIMPLEKLTMTVSVNFIGVFTSLSFKSTLLKNSKL